MATTKTQSGTILKDVKFNLDKNTFTRTGYDFKGWSTNSSATTATYSDGQNVSFSSNTVLYAVWEKSIIRSVNPVQATMSSGYTLTGSKGTNSNSAPPMLAWVFGGHHFTNARGYADAWYTTGGVNVITQFDTTSPLIGTRTITYNKTLGGLGITPAPETKAVTCGLGGTCVNTLTVSNMKKLFTRIDICPYISCAIESGLSSSTYKNGLNRNNWYWEDSSNETALVYTSGAQKSVFSRGQCYRVSMRIKKPDNSTVDLTIDITDRNTKSDYGWTTYNASSHQNHFLTFDFASLIVAQKLPYGSYTEYITFRQGTSFTGMKNMAIHGSRYFYHS